MGNHAERKYKVINIIEGVPDESPMGAEIRMKMYTTVFNMCTQKPPHNYTEKLYERYQGVYNDYLQSKVLPAIQEVQDDDVSMLQELVKRWANHKFMVRKLCQFFSHLDPSYVYRRRIPSLKDVAFSCFLIIVYEKMKVKVRDVVIASINQEHQGTEIDRTLVRDALEVFVEIGGNENGKDKLDYYVNDFETAFLSDMVDYYTRKGCNEITAAECFQREKDRVSHYLHFSTKERVLKQVQGQGVA